MTVKQSWKSTQEQTRRRNQEGDPMFDVAETASEDQRRDDLCNNSLNEKGEDSTTLVKPQKRHLSIQNTNILNKVFQDGGHESWYFREKRLSCKMDIGTKKDI